MLILRRCIDALFDGTFRPIFDLCFDISRMLKSINSML